MALSMTINGNTEKAVAFSLNINDNVNARSVSKFIVDTDNSITVGQEVLIYDGVTLIFGGTIDTYSLEYLRGSGGSGSRKRYNISAVDFNQITDRRRVAATYENKTVSYIVNDLVTNYLNGENITVGTISKGTLTISQAVFNYITVAQAFDFIRDAAGGDLNWNIDYTKELSFFQRADNTGDSFDDSNTYNIKIKETRKDYRNSQLVRAGDSTTEVQVKEVASPKPDGESRTFTHRFPLATKPTIYVNDVAISDSDVGINGLDISKKWYWQKNSRQITQDETETVLSATDTLTTSYQGLKPIIVQADNPASQNDRAFIEGGTGIYQMVDNQKSLDNKDAALEYANGLLVRYGTIPRNITITTDSTRNAGELIQVQSNNLGINEDFLITNAQAYDFDGCGTLRYTISGASGEDVGTWVEFFRSLTTGGDLSIKENEVLVLLQTIQETTGWQGNTTIKAFQPSFFSETLIFDDDVYFGNLPIDTEVVND